MRNRFLAIAVFIMMASLTAAWAAGASGKWSARAGDVDITLVFKADGTALTGTVNNPLSAGDTPIQEGKVNGDEISFCLKRTINDNEVKVVWKGKITGDEIKFKRDIQGQTGSTTEITAKRLK
jgi:hypothetical protein